MSAIVVALIALIGVWLNLPKQQDAQPDPTQPMLTPTVLSITAPPVSQVTQASPVLATVALVSNPATPRPQPTNSRQNLFEHDYNLESWIKDEASQSWLAAKWGGYNNTLLTVQPDNQNPHDGNYAVRISPIGAGKAKFGNSGQRGLAADGQTLLLTFYYQTAGEVDANLLLERINADNNQVSFYCGMTREMPDAVEWTQARIAFVAEQTNSTLFRITFEVGGAGVVWLDTFALTATESVADPCNLHLQP